MSTTFQESYDKMSEAMNTTFADWLVREMEDRDWNQSDLARASGITRQAINYLLSEKSKSPSDESLQRIAHAFKLPVEQVYRAAGKIPTPPNTNEMIEQIMHEVDGMPEADQQE